MPALFMTVMLGFLLAALFGIQNAVWRRRAVCGLLVLNLAGNINVVYQNFGAGIANVYLDAGSVWDSYTGDKPLNRAKKLLGTSGSEELKRIADTVCKSVWEDGIYHEFRRMGIC